ncbi:MAG: AraC family transcriptional regulator [Lachnospiraceae bacterium]|nr:AraC family transcriptional regulator [Lachnospiraceae bacterium]
MAKAKTKPKAPEPTTVLTGVDFVKFVNWESSDDFYLYEMGRYACIPGYSFERTVSQRCILHFVISGKGSLVLDGVTHEVHAGQAFLIPDGCHAFYQADRADPWSYLWLHIGGPKLPDVFRRAGLSEKCPVFTPAKRWDKIKSLLEDILKHYDREYYCIGNLYKIFDYMMEYSVNKEDNTVDSSLLYVKNVIGYIKLKYSDPIKVETIAYAFGLNRSYLTRLFKDATGYTMQQYLLIYRMKVAMQMLKEGDKNVQDIALAVGYGDSFTFSKAFKRHFGHSPSYYRGIMEENETL